MVRKIDPTQYEHIWTVEGVPYLFDSLYFSVAFPGYDFVAVNENAIHTLYVGKESLKRLGAIGLKLHMDGFEEYKSKTTAKYPQTQEFIEKERARDLSKLSNEELHKTFSHFVANLQKLCADYFWTEKFCLDEVENKLNNPTPGFDTIRLQKNVEAMGRLKLEQRDLLNQIALYPPTLLDRYALEISKRFRIENITQYHYVELLDLLKGKQVTILDRSCVVRGTFSDWKDVGGEEARALARALHAAEESHHVPNELNGRIGNKGTYTGKVRVIKLRVGDPQMFRELEAVEQGEVLVSESTGPDMILAMKRAGAIVTEAGGITSHAAIVSRELGKPCVINVRRVTQHLKTGDMVLVDGDRGLVIKI